MSGADDELLDELAALLAAENDPPPEVLDAARGALAWRTVDAELAALTYDSLLDDAPAAVRAAAHPRALTFAADDLSVEVEVESSARGRRLIGQVVPPQAVRLVLRGDEQDLGQTSSDDLGRFVLDLPARPRLLVLRVQRPGGPGIDCSAVVL